jgi:hypothetical protein
MLSLVPAAMKTFALSTFALATAQASSDANFEDASAGAGAISRQSGSSDLTLTNSLELNLAESLAQLDRGGALGFNGAPGDDTVYIVREKGTLNLHITPVTADLIVKGKSLAADMTCRTEHPKHGDCATGQYTVGAGCAACPPVVGCDAFLVVCAADGSGSYCKGCSSGFYGSAPATATNTCTKCHSVHGCGTNEMGNSQVSCDSGTGANGFCKDCAAGYANSEGAGVANNQCTQCTPVAGCSASNSRCAADGSGGWCAQCEPRYFGTLGNNVQGNQCSACTGNDNNALNCVNGDHHRCQGPTGTLSSFGTFCDHCAVSQVYNSLGPGVEGNMCVTCPDANVDNHLNCVNQGLHKCTNAAKGLNTVDFTSPAGTTTKSYCDHCAVSQVYNSLGPGVIGNMCPSCPDANVGNHLNCVNQGLHKCTDAAKGLNTVDFTSESGTTKSYCDHCTPNNYFNSLGPGQIGNMCSSCPDANVGNKLNCVNQGHYRCSTSGGPEVTTVWASGSTSWCDHCPANGPNGNAGTLGNGVEGTQC